MPSEKKKEGENYCSGELLRTEGENGKRDDDLQTN